MQSDQGDENSVKQKKRKFNQTTICQDSDRNAIESSGRASEPKMKKIRSKLDRQKEASQTSSISENLTAEHVSI
jgi:hypothetical protein